MLNAVTEGNFKETVLAARRPVLVDFYADWCGPCRALAPVLDEVARDFAGRLEVRKLDVDQNQVVASMYGVMSLPTLILFSGGQVKGRWVGFVNKAALLARLEAAVPVVGAPA